MARIAFALALALIVVSAGAATTNPSGERSEPYPAAPAPALAPADSSAKASFDVATADAKSKITTNGRSVPMTFIYGKSAFVLDAADEAAGASNKARQLQQCEAGNYLCQPCDSGCCPNSCSSCSCSARTCSNCGPATASISSAAVGAIITSIAAVIGCCCFCMRLQRAAQTTGRGNAQAAPAVVRRTSMASPPGYNNGTPGASGSAPPRLVTVFLPPGKLGIKYTPPITISERREINCRFIIREVNDDAPLSSKLRFQGLSPPCGIVSVNGVELLYVDDTEIKKELAKAAQSGMAIALVLAFPAASSSVVNVASPLATGTVPYALAASPYASTESAPLAAEELPWAKKAAAPTPAPIEISSRRLSSRGSFTAKPE